MCGVGVSVTRLAGMCVYENVCDYLSVCGMCALGTCVIVEKCMWCV